MAGNGGCLLNALDTNCWMRIFSKRGTLSTVAGNGSFVGLGGGCVCFNGIQVSSVVGTGTSTARFCSLSIAATLGIGNGNEGGRMFVSKQPCLLK